MQSLINVNLRDIYMTSNKLTYNTSKLTLFQTVHIPVMQASKWKAICYHLLKLLLLLLLYCFEN